MDPLGKRLFPERTIPCVTKSAYSNNTTQPAPGYPLLASNIMTRLWNTVPGLKTATSWEKQIRWQENGLKLLPVDSSLDFVTFCYLTYPFAVTMTDL